MHGRANNNLTDAEILQEEAVEKYSRRVRLLILTSLTVVLWTAIIMGLKTAGLM